MKSITKDVAIFAGLDNFRFPRMIYKLIADGFTVDPSGHITIDDTTAVLFLSKNEFMSKVGDAADVRVNKAEVTYGNVCTHMLMVGKKHNLPETYVKVIDFDRLLHNLRNSSPAPSNDDGYDGEPHPIGELFIKSANETDECVVGYIPSQHLDFAIKSHSASDCFSWIVCAGHDIWDTETPQTLGELVARINGQFLCGSLYEKLPAVIEEVYLSYKDITKLSGLAQKHGEMTIAFVLTILNHLNLIEPCEQESGRLTDFGEFIANVFELGCFEVKGVILNPAFPDEKISYAMSRLQKT